VCDTENVEIGLPCVTYALRGIVELLVEVRTAAAPVHSGMAGGVLADAAIALNVILSRLYWGHKKLPIPGIYDKVRKMTGPEKRAAKKVGGDEAKWRSDQGVLDGVELALERNVSPNEATWRKPSITVIVQEASSLVNKSNQVLPKAKAYISCRIVPDMDPEETYEQIKAVLVKDPPWGVKVEVTPTAKLKWWMTDPTGPAFTAAQKALKKGFGVKPVPIGCGGSIGFVGPLAELFGGAPALLLGIEDPLSKAHAPNESLHAGDFRKLTASLSHLFEQIGDLPEGKVK
jgi:acetylornithine deacetylase/succinyl-diaminopimelate desuccinylase-like protein